MKLKKIISLTFALFALTMFGFAQQEQAEAPMFGNVRGTSVYKHDFTNVQGKAVSHQFKITNNGKTTMWIKDIEIPERVGVTILSKKIVPGTEGILTVTIDPTIAEKGVFSKKIVVITEQTEENVKTTQEISFEVAGEIK